MRLAAKHSAAHFFGSVQWTVKKNPEGMILAALFRSPIKKEEIKNPIRQSVRELFARNRVKAEAVNAARLIGQGKAEKKNQKDRDK